MIKFIIPALIILLLVIFWEKLNKLIHNKFNIRINYVVSVIFLTVLGIIFVLLYF